MVSGDTSGVVVINDIHNGKCQRRIRFKDQVITSLTLSSDGLKVVVGTLGNGLSMWDLKSVKKIKDFRKFNESSKDYDTTLNIVNCDKNNFWEKFSE